MAELLPTLVATDVRGGLVDYLTTTFALADPEAAQALGTFLDDPHDGMFKGPYARLRLPFRPAADDWRGSLGWDPGLVPYGHQSEAYRRLTSNDLGPDKPRPLPTLVTTGTGSGKTEAFLHPILDHCVRANREGVTGTKAIVLYPMNALATDQAGRLTALLTNKPELSSVTAGIYVGESDGSHRTKVGRRGLINDRGTMRENPPDILLTNYKMLDQLLLRQQDQGIWAKSATSLTYLVLDEFHTYDGAQGTDVAMLLRRLGLALKSHWSDTDPKMSTDDRTRPLGRLTPVATSATLGGGGDPGSMLRFAETVFGEAFPRDAVVTESRLDLDDWVGDAVSSLESEGLTALPLRSLLSGEIAVLAEDCRQARDDIERLTATVLSALVRSVGGGPAGAARTGLGDLGDAGRLLVLVKALPDVRALAARGGDAASMSDLVVGLFPTSTLSDDADRSTVVDALLAVLSHVRALAGRGALTVELNLWVRELTRIDRDASMTTAFRWSDDGGRASDLDGEPVPPSFPAIYCRHCGRSGWGIELAATGDDLHADDANIRRRHARREGRFRPLLTALAEADRSLGHGPSGRPEDIPGLAWLSVPDRTLRTALADPDAPDVRSGLVLPVLTHRGADADERGNDDTCPSCLQRDGIRFLGSAIATLLSVALSGMFGDASLDPREKKALVFTDSVQDAAHRAGFVEARSATLTFRAVLRDALGEERCNLDELAERVFHRAGDDPFRRYRMVPPDCVGRDEFDAWWDPHFPADERRKARAWVKRRLLFDAVLEFGLQSAVGRTLERTGAVAVMVEAGAASKLEAVGRRALAESADDTLDTPLAETSGEQVVAWVRGLLEHVRRQGGIHHEWLARYIASDGRRHFIWGGRPRTQGMPAFPAGRAAPAFPRVGGGSGDRQPLLDPVTSAQSWYALWTARSLHVSVQHGAKLARLLFDRLVDADVLTAISTESGGRVFAVPATSVVVVPLGDQELAGAPTLLVCDVCRTQTNGAPEVVRQLEGSRCDVARCVGRVHAAGREDNFYRRLYASGDMRRIVSREHSSLLDDELRLEYERDFKAGSADPGAPNVLVATPTLEMGIDIGDLSSVVLASLPDTVASYLQRVGRAGRLTGNALNLAFVTGRGEYLPRLGDPLSVINGEVRPPATYLDAAEILRRQYLASVVDGLARDPSRSLPRKAAAALQTAGEGSFLADLVSDAEEHAEERLTDFLGSLGLLGEAASASLVRWATPDRTEDGEPDAGTSGLAATVYAAAQRWQSFDSGLAFRRQEILSTIPALKAAAESPAATDDDKRDFRSARATLVLVEKQHDQHRTEPWIAALEEYGLLPNYTLLDDTVTLDVSVTWRDPETNAFVSEPRSFDRAAANALREFAPGATFYARGLEMEIDGLDLGPRAANVRRWAWCDCCGYGVDLEQSGQAVSTCPRCGSLQIADAGQRLDVVELVRVMSEVRRDEHRIGESRDERKRTQFVLVPAPDFDPAKVTRQWTAAEGGFGVAHYDGMVLRWVNAGRVAAGAVMARRVAGQGTPNTLFRVCSSCGKADSETNANVRSEHRPWCPQRTSPTETARSVALTRSLTTQGLALTLPTSVTLGDVFAVPSLAAALLLGLRERMGGNPDHISVVTVPAPVAEGSAGEVRDALLLHDTVPGGTGYLTDLAQPQEIWSVLATAHRVVAGCECRLENRLACHRCLLPFSRGLGADKLSRVAAERHLRAMLLGDAAEEGAVADPTSPAWAVTEGPVVASGESPLELLFRQVFTERMVAINATVKEKPGPSGNVLTVTLPHDARVWNLTPQVSAHGSKPDFVLRSSDPHIPPVAIFTDGHTFHASPQHNVVAADAQKRNTLRAHGYVVLGLTDADLVPGSPKAPDVGWVSTQVTSQLMAQPAGSPGGGINQDAVDVLRAGPVAFLVSWIQQPHDAPRQALADAVWMLVGSQVGVSELGHLDVGIGEAARAMVRGEAVASGPGGTQGIWWQSGHVGVLTTVDTEHQQATETALVLDDRPEAVAHPAHAAAWRRWLQLSNAFATTGHPVVLVTSASGLVADSADGSVADRRRQEMLERVAPEWAALLRQVDAGVATDLIAAWSAAGVRPPVYGAEVADGIPVDFAWLAERVAVLLEGDDDTVADLVAAGWRVAASDVNSVVTALGARQEGR
ncbi:DEAD/DEAH box helicase [Phycicoccus sp. DTK01]|uniref:DEAD/DEAH box helicase n=1 Tax=Phycicoccus sp. DTK01 TaxID=2785745 RepID=UPI001A8D4F1C|nr:DEAD/DEAH box helicase [Phycicoccus sp. DTK01]GIL33998.1 helicase [Phycicoccus sp. DTK01]